LEKLRIAFATNEKKGLDDVTSGVFGRAKTFTILDIDDQNITDITILDNDAATYHHGAGPLAVKMLVDNDVTLVFSNNLGLGASELLKDHCVRHIAVKPNTKIFDILQKNIDFPIKNLKEFKTTSSS
jgi:predicted Fe-Mo cluster-binding NifX family protein